MDQPREHGSLSLHVAALLILALVTLGCGQPKTISTFPMWEIADPNISCHQDLEIHSWFAKSGKEGAGLVLRFDNKGDVAHTVGVDSATMHIRKTRRSRSDTTMNVESGHLDVATVDDHHTIYLPFVFDNNRAWNRGHRKATVDIALEIDNEPVALAFEAHHLSASWDQKYERYGRWKMDNPMYALHKLFDSRWNFILPVWGPDEEMANIYRTGPLIISDDPDADDEERLHEGQFLRMDPKKPKEYRIRFEQNAQYQCDGTAYE